MFCFVFLGGLVLKKKKRVRKKRNLWFCFVWLCLHGVFFFLNLTGKLICAVYANKNLGLSGVLCK